MRQRGASVERMSLLSCRGEILFLLLRVLSLVWYCFFATCCFAFVKDLYIYI